MSSTKGRRKGGGGAAPTGEDTPPPAPSKPENGYYKIVDLAEGDFDWRPKDPTVDPPVGQAKLAEKTRQIYSWCVDYVPLDEDYQKYCKRLREIFFLGAVQEPIAPRVTTLLTELEWELARLAERILRLQAYKAAKWRLLFAVAGSIIGALLFIRNAADAGAVRNFVFLAALAMGSAAIPTRVRTPLKELAQFDAEVLRYERPIMTAIEGLVMVLGASILIQNKWITVAIAGQALDISGNIMIALAVGFILGLANERLIQLVSPVVDRFFRSARRAGPARGGSRQGQT